MISTSGKIAVADSDALIGLVFENDALHERCLKISAYLTQNGFEVFVPYPIVLEAATALAKDKMIKRPELAQTILRDYESMGLETPSNRKIEKMVAEIYNPKTSKKNSPFDFYVLACARANGIKTVFSFDSFYKKNGLTLAEELVSL